MMEESNPKSRNSAVLFDPLRTEANIKALNAFEEIIRTSVGPYAHSKFITHVEGGVGKLTTSSKTLLSSISFRNIILKFIVKTMNNHLTMYNNGGLVAILLTLKLIKYSSDSEMILPLAGKLFEHFGRLFLNFLKSGQNDCIFDIDWSKLGQIRGVVETILLSKPQCCLSKDSLKYLSLLLIKTHLSTVPGTSGVYVHRKINYVALPNENPKQSKLLSGLLIRFPEVSKDLNCFPWTIEKLLLGNANLCKGEKIRIVLYSISLSGDADFPIDKAEVQNAVDVWKTVLKFLQDLAQRIIKMNVQILACQKVVHPSVRNQLESADILVLDRLGVETAKNLQYLSGSSNSSFFGELSVGYITDVCIEKLGKRREDPKFLLLSNKEKPFWTLLVRNYCVQAVEETRIVCEQALDTLWRLLKTPNVCYGGGCTEFYTGQLVEKKVFEEIEQIRSDFGCSSSQVLEALHIFLKSITDIPAAINRSSSLNLVTESSSNHLWKGKSGSFPSIGDKCLCGVKTVDSVSDPKWKVLDKSLAKFFLPDRTNDVKSPVKIDELVLLDELHCKVSAYSVAFEAASLLLRSTLCIQS